MRRQIEIGLRDCDCGGWQTQSLQDRLVECRPREELIL